MSSHSTRLVSTCPACGEVERIPAAELLNRLRALGMLKRDDAADLNVALQLARAAADRLNCPVCGRGGVSIELAHERDEWERPAKRCAACGAAIPAERLELFPDSDLCAACQQRIDGGQSPDQHDDFCPRCGTRMIVRQRRGAGIAAYEQVCPACRR